MTNPKQDKARNEGNTRGIHGVCCILQQHAQIPAEEACPGLDPGSKWTGKNGAAHVCRGQAFLATFSTIFLSHSDDICLSPMRVPACRSQNNTLHSMLPYPSSRRPFDGEAELGSHKARISRRPKRKASQTILLRLQANIGVGFQERGLELGSGSVEGLGFGCAFS